MENLKQASGENLSTATAPEICFKKKSPKNLSSFSLQFIFFFRTAVLRKLFDIRFSHKDSNFKIQISTLTSESSFRVFVLLSSLAYPLI